MKSNYDVQQEMARQLFLEWDQEEIIRRFALESDGAYLYVPFFHCRHRIGRADGRIEEAGEGGWRPAGFNAHLSIYDALCRPGPAPLAGRWSPLNQLKGLSHPGVGENSLHASYLDAFSGRGEDLDRACRAMEGRPFPVGDRAWVLDAFPFLPLVFQFWEGDEEFPPRIRLLWDENTLDLIHYETAWYVAFCCLDLVRSLLG